MTFKKLGIVAFMLLLTKGASGLFSQEPQSHPIDQWLIAGPFTTSFPIHAKRKDLFGKTFSTADLFDETKPLTETFIPAQGDTFYWSAKERSIWKPFQGSEKAHLLPNLDDTLHHQVCFLASYFRITRFSRLKLTCSSFQYFQVSIDGHVKMEKQSADVIQDTVVTIPGSVSSQLILESGEHTIFVTALKDPKSDLPWQFEATIERSDSLPSDVLLSNSPAAPLSFDHLMTAPYPADVSITPDGKFMAVQMRQYHPEQDHVESWVEIRRVQNGTLAQSFRGIGQMTAVQWAPAGHRFASLLTNRQGGAIWMTDLDSGETRSLCEHETDLDSFQWMPDGTGLVVSKTEDPAPDNGNLLHLQSNQDRQPGHRAVTSLYRLDAKSGRMQRLTFGKQSVFFCDMASDCQKLVYRKDFEDIRHRPYTRSTLFVLDLETGVTDSLGTYSWLEDVSFSPDGKSLLLLCGPSGMQPDSVLVNAYNTQAYLFDLKTHRTTCLTKAFIPAMMQARWSKQKSIFFKAKEADRDLLYQYDVSNQTFTKLPVSVDCVREWDLSHDQSTLVYTGYGVNTWTRVYKLDMNKQKAGPLFDPAAKTFSQVRFGDVHDWHCETAPGPVQARYYLPPGFDSGKQYPCLVYYYGGVAPVARTFGGRYPFELYAAHGYVVLVLNPSGCIGSGSAHADAHVNDWGKRTASEIIEASHIFLNEHPFIDSSRVGCIGASYGGFLTELLITQTNLFKAAASHAGISNIASYWGEGFWGVEYNAVSAANSFPWNRRDIYVDQSPLYHADKITTPLLLLHGDEDTNVPVGESIQMYNALKLLNKPVELIFVKGQDHHINQPQKRKEWTYTILAWFDQWLKEEPAWWESLWEERN